MTARTMRCAIYTRKSSEEGLDQDFNSLDAQHEACAAYIASQRHEGWKLVPTRYDDGGVSGGTLERPALQRLLADIEAGRIDMIVVYKIDRLTRSLSDFAKLVDRLDAVSCSFVSVTQAFNTSSSMGRLTLNMLLSFAQFEREVTAERIRDKIAASKKKGLWMGGLAPLGYDPHPDPNRRELVINEDEVRTVRQLFALYLEAGCLNATAKAANASGLRSKRRVFATGRAQGGTEFSRGQIYKILTNPVYRGLIKHKDTCWSGTHKAIVDQGLWEQVQARLQVASARRRGSIGPKATSGAPNTSAPLMGKMRDETGDLLTPTHTQRHGRRLRYYVSNRLLTGTRHPKGWRVPAQAFEQAVATAIAEHLENHAKTHRFLTDIRASTALDAAENVMALAARIRDRGATAASRLIASGTIAPGLLRITLDPTALAEDLGQTAEDLAPDFLEIETRFTCRRRGVEMKVIAGETAPAPDPALIRALRNAHRWTGMIRSGISIKEISRSDGVSESYAARIAPMAMLSPRIQEAILAGTQPLELTLETVVRSRLPLDWVAQEARLGFASLSIP